VISSLCRLLLKSFVVISIQLSVNKTYRKDFYTNILLYRTRTMIFDCVARLKMKIKCSIDVHFAFVRKKKSHRASPHRFNHKDSINKAILI